MANADEPPEDDDPIEALSIILRRSPWGSALASAYTELVLRSVLGEKLDLTEESRRVIDRVVYGHPDERPVNLNFFDARRLELIRDILRSGAGPQAITVGLNAIIKRFSAGEPIDVIAELELLKSKLGPPLPPISPA